MADEIDRAQERIEREHALILAQRMPAGPAATGECLWCGEPLAPGLRWCDADCRDAWEANHKLR